MAKAELGRGLKQAIVADVFMKNGVKTFKRAPSSDVKERIITQAQTRLDKFRDPANARQITNWLLRNSDDYTPSELAARLKAKSVAPSPKKAKAKKASPRKSPSAPSAESQQAAA
jgi:hypothetical protein